MVKGLVFGKKKEAQRSTMNILVIKDIIATIKVVLKFIIQ